MLRSVAGRDDGAWSSTVGGGGDVTGSLRRRGARLPGLLLGASVAAEATVRRIAGGGGGAGERAAPPVRKVFVVGCPRSGTTWVQAILQHHPLALGTTESHAYGRTDPVRRHGHLSRRGWGALFAEPGPHPSVGLQWYADRRTLRHLAVDAATRARSGDEAADRFVAAVFDAFVEREGGSPAHLLVEKTPNHLLHARRILTQFPEARMIEVVRDGRDVCASLDARLPYITWGARDRRTQVATWVRYVEAGEALRADPAFSDRVVRVRFEDLKAQPEAEVRRLFAFADLEVTDDDVGRIVASTDFSRAGGRSDGSSPNRKGEVGDWANHFTEADAALFAELAAGACAAAGYRL